jgi:hypothetical protein
MIQSMADQKDIQLTAMHDTEISFAIKNIIGKTGKYMSIIGIYNRLGNNISASFLI